MIVSYIERWGEFFPALVPALLDAAPWNVVADLPQIIGVALDSLGSAYHWHGDIAVHRSATVEAGATLKGPAIIGPGCLVASGAYLRGGVWLLDKCTIGPGAEVKTSLIFPGSALAHFNFVGDSILGSGVNLEAGSIIANHRNELDGDTMRIVVGEQVVETGVTKFGALVGDGARIGANAVVAPGALLARGAIVARLGLIDQRPV